MLNKNKVKKEGLFYLYDLKVEVVNGDSEMVCRHKIGDYFELKGEQLSIPSGQTFSIYALAAILPLLSVKQRLTHKNDWITTDSIIACPDPNCGAQFKIIRGKLRKHYHSDDTVVPLIKI